MALPALVRAGNISGGKMFDPAELGLDPPTRYLGIEHEQRTTAVACHSQGDRLGEARALLVVAWATEKLGNGDSALEHARAARVLLESREDLDLLGECCHSLGVYQFHHIDGPPPVDEFMCAIEARLESGNLVGAAQSWHNLGYVFLTSGEHERAVECYANATSLLRLAQENANEDFAGFIDRQQGFVLSHLAFTAARHNSAEDAAQATLQYFQHVAKTGAHREPVLAYLAPGVALGAAKESPRITEFDELAESVGVAALAEAWLRTAVAMASDAMVQHKDTGTGRHAYLGSHLLALAELADWCFRNKQPAEAADLWGKAQRLALARGWRGEASRADRRRVMATEAKP